MKQIAILFLFCLLLSACSDDKNEEPILVTNIVVTDADKVFKPGETITITAQGFLENDRFMVDIRWPLDEPSGPIKEGSQVSNPIGEVRTDNSITFLVPGHNPAATLKLLLMRGDKTMTLCQVSVADGQAPKELQLYGITNANAMNGHPRGIQHIDLTTGIPTDVVTLAQGEDFSLVTNVPGNYTLCGLLKQDGKTSIGSFDLSTSHWKSNASSSLLTFGNGAGEVFAIAQADEKNLTIYAVNTSYLTRLNMPAPANPTFPIPAGFKPETLSRYTGVMNGSSMLFSADNGDGTFSPVVFDLRSGKYAIRIFDPIQADALIPFKFTIPKEAPNPDNSYKTVCAFAVVNQSKPNGTELRLWNAAQNTLEASFATFPNPARSIAPHYSEDMKTQELYVLFDSNQSGSIIEIYDILKKEWRPFRNFGFPYSEILFAK